MTRPSCSSFLSTSSQPHVVVGGRLERRRRPGTGTGTGKSRSTGDDRDLGLDLDLDSRPIGSDSAASSSLPSSSSTSTMSTTTTTTTAADGSNVYLSTKLCKECGGRRMIRTSAGFLPCPVCVPWSLRQEYVERSTSTLVTPSDLNELKRALGMDGDAADGEKQSDANGDDKRRKREVKMTEERRLAIQRGMQGRGPLPEDHRRRISAAVRERYKADPSLRQAGRPKKCSVCGEEGHNKKTCPAVLVADGYVSSTNGAAASSASTSSASTSSTKRRRKPSTCSLCGQAGHRKTACPQNQGNQGSNANANAMRTQTVATPATTPSAIAFIESKSEAPRTPQTTFPLPTTTAASIDQAALAVRRAFADGVRLQTVEILLRDNEMSAWPGGIQQQFRVALPMIESLLMQLKSTAGLEGRITAEFLDETDCVGLWQSERLAAVVFPTAESIPALMKVGDALSGERLTLCVNPQWQLDGQIVSDLFFIGYEERRRSERFARSLETTYCLEQRRVLGCEVRIMRCYPGAWQVYAYVEGVRVDTKDGASSITLRVPSANSSGEWRVLSTSEEARPTYERLVELLKAAEGGDWGRRSWLDRLMTTGHVGGSGRIADDVVKGAKDIITGEFLSPGEEQPNS